MKKLIQESGDDSTNIQAENVTINQGLSYSDVKEIYEILFRENFVKMREESANVAEQRAMQLWEKFYQRIELELGEFPQEKFTQPRESEIVFDAMKISAKSEDRGIDNLLVDLLIERSKSDDRDLQQILFEEALAIADKVTQEQLKTLAVSFFLSYPSAKNFLSKESFNAYLTQNIAPLVNDSMSKSITFKHLEHLGCGRVFVDHTRKTLGEIFQNTAKYLFYHGFDKTIDIPFLQKFSTELLVPAFGNSDKFQINPEILFHFDRLAADNTFTEQNKESLKEILQNLSQFKRNASMMSWEEIENYISSYDERLRLLKTYWDSSPIGLFIISPVGVALAFSFAKSQGLLQGNFALWLELL